MSDIPQDYHELTDMDLLRFAIGLPEVSFLEHELLQRLTYYVEEYEDDTSHGNDT